jgi:hypothetical protein
MEPNILDVDLGVFRVGRVQVSNAGLLRIAATPTGTLLDEPARSRLTAQEALGAKPPSFLVTEVVFNSRSVGITLENSKVYPEQVYVRDFSSGSSPALESGAIAVGDVLLGASSGRRHIRSTGELSELTDFVQAAGRPVTLRFVRDLCPVVDLDQVSAESHMAESWVGSLGVRARSEYACVGLTPPRLRFCVEIAMFPPARASATAPGLWRKTSWPGLGRRRRMRAARTW